MKIPKKYANLVFAFTMSLLMALIMSGVLTALFAGIDHQFISHWLRAFIHAWPIAFPAILIIAPIVKKIVGLITE
ncbi:MAG: DUF2798 domain-containing protein [Methylotenera sp.]